MKERVRYDFFGDLLAGGQPLNIVAGKVNTANEPAVPRLRRSFEEVTFAVDSALEGAGFEPSIPLAKAW
jgi:hypothetical protein